MTKCAGISKFSYKKCIYQIEIMHSFHIIGIKTFEKVKNNFYTSLN